MAFGSEPLSGRGLPLSCGYLPDSGLTALQSSVVAQTDNSSNTTAGFVMTDQLLQSILLGQAYVATTTLLNTATNPNLIMGMSVFNPSSSKGMYVFSAQWYTVSSSNAFKVFVTSSNPSFPNPLTPINLKIGGPASVASVTSAANGASASLTITGSQTDLHTTTGQTGFEFLTTRYGFYLPPGAGVSIFGTVATAGQTWAATMRWIEF